ncbi:MAG: hypothetical protein OEW21_04200 [Betaproteobacteria bacterium]|nr:hypothetical protein [Betaproteobacteria bacterium]
MDLFLSRRRDTNQLSAGIPRRMDRLRLFFIWVNLLAVTALLGILPRLAVAATYVFGTLTDAPAPGYLKIEPGRLIPDPLGRNTFTDTTRFRLITEDCKQSHCQELVQYRKRPEDSYRTVRQYYSAKVRGRSDYDGKHYLVMEVSSCKECKPAMVVVRQDGRTWSLASVKADAKILTIGVTYDEKLITVTREAQAILGFDGRVEMAQRYPVPLEAAYLGTDGKRHWAVAGIAEDQTLWVGNSTAWLGTEGPVVSARSDRESVLSVYPNGETEFVAAVYVNINPYNKGVMLIHANWSSRKVRHAWAVNSEDTNYGFFPAVVWRAGNIQVGGMNSSADRPFTVTIPEGRVRSMEYRNPEHVSTWEQEEQVSAMVGGSLSMLRWGTKADVSDSGGNTLSNVNYEIADTLFKGINAEGRYGDKHFAISYLRSQAEDKILPSGGRLAKEASSFLTGYVDFNSFLAKSHSMRLNLERADIKGVATYNDPAGTQAEQFNNRYTRLDLLDVGERGQYLMVQYTQAVIPTPLGFGQGKSVSLLLFEPNADFRELAFGIGYDKAAYAKRYEANYRAWYVNGSASLGLGHLGMTDKTKQAVAARFGKEPESLSLFLGLHATGEVGYLLQQRAKSLRGLGYSVAAGVRLQADWLGMGGSSDDNSQNVNASFSRSSTLYGPFVRVNAIF